MNSDPTSETLKEPATEAAQPLVLPILPLRNALLYPGILMPLNIGRASSLRMLEESLPQSKVLGLVLQKDDNHEEPTMDQLHPVGISAKVVRMLRQGENGAIILVQGESRIRIVKAVQEAPYLKAEVEVLAPQPLSKDDDYQQAALRNLKEAAARLLNLKPDVPDEIKGALEQIDDAVSSPISWPAISASKPRRSSACWKR
jgi:ATP-dependent Lon protease